MDKVKDRRLKLIDKISRKRHWSFGDSNPYFDEVYTIMPKIEAKTYREYKKKLKIEKEKYEKMAMFNSIRTSLCV